MALDMSHLQPIGEAFQRLAQAREALDAVPDGGEHDDARVNAQAEVNVCVREVDEATRVARMPPAQVEQKEEAAPAVETSAAAVSAETMQELMRRAEESHRAQIDNLQITLSTVLKETLQQVARANTDGTVQGRHWTCAGLGYNAKLAGFYASLDGNLTSWEMFCHTPSTFRHRNPGLAGRLHNFLWYCMSSRVPHER